jgi:hypothetical protein
MKKWTFKEVVIAVVIFIVGLAIAYLSAKSI